ncbi:YceI family protein [Chitinophaga sp. S165]|uniref:YceI family protein n=1 Tax=Chitinophaga sp. S165 TaxID=2135462 RepID=UPI000D711B48|nr:YceI family protein [Chitinophaga sp. S165]PWV46956.1 polyisoprenoid-binding protein YceI [Chitinophaga sp. S165]
MKKLIIFSSTLLLTAAVFAFAVAAQAWNINGKYNITFSSNAVSGIFKTFKGTIAFDEKNLAASNFNVTVDVASINTGNALQNKHAKSDEWFDAAKYPEIKYASKKIVKTATGYQVTGDLEIHGIKKEFSIPFTFKPAGNGATFNGTFKVNRNDFHIGKPGGDVEDVINVTVAVPVVKA